MFLVQHDPDWPFRVWTNDKTLAEAKGTAFSVRTEGGQTEVVVTQGRVRVYNATQESTLVEAGYAVSIRGGIESTSRLADSDLNDRLRWVELFPGNATPELAEIVHQLNRVNELQLVIDDAAIAHIKVGAVLMATDPASFAEALAGYKTSIKHSETRENDKRVIHLSRSKSGR
jgi:ferric-dicitrate binding protein FerR (iron transport regulator)